MAIFAPPFCIEAIYFVVAVIDHYGRKEKDMALDAKTVAEARSWLGRPTTTWTS
jgi:hypothetical protein